MNPQLVLEQANIEISVAQGGYGRRQIYELVQNGADELLDYGGGKIEILLTAEALYCANEGDPLSEHGVNAILASHLSRKRGNEIGRFGLGFKSVLGITTRPEVYSRSGSFRCDPAEAERLIRAVAPASELIPRMRIAQPVDPQAAALEDPNLAELQQWATTVIKLPLDLSRSHWLSEDIKNFPAEFLLFCPHVTDVVFEDRTQGVRRAISLKRNGDRVMLEEGAEHSVWKVFKKIHIPSAAAHADAGTLAARNDLPLAWAVPVKGRQERGVFWAFFPTEYYTTLSGKLNAPWKTNEDRQNLLTGVFNTEMIEAAAILIAESLPQLVDAEEPGRFLDLLPARGREAPNWADELLTRMVYEHVGRAKCLPDQNGKLGYAAAIRLHPGELPKEALEIWSQCPARPTNWCHPSVETSQRRSRVERLVTSAGQAPQSLAVWLESLLKAPGVEGSKAAIRCAAKIVQALPKMRVEVETACIVLTTAGVPVAPRPTAVFLPVDEAGQGHPGLTLVHPELAADAGTVEALAILGIRQVDATSGLKTLLATGDVQTMSDAEWERFWQLARRVPVEEALQIVRSEIARSAAGKDPRGVVKVRTLDGQFRRLRQTLLPGHVARPEESKDAACTLDLGYHGSEQLLLAGLGAVASPVQGGGSMEEFWFGNYRDACLGIYQDQLGDRKTRPMENYLQFDGALTVGPLEPLFLLGEAGRARFTAALLPAIIEEPAWVLAHSTRRDSYPAVPCEPPSLFVARQHGRMATSAGLLPVEQCVGPDLEAWRAFLPVADCTHAAAARLRLPKTLAELRPSHWGWCDEQNPDAFDDRSLASFYAALSEFRATPARVRCRVGAEWAFLPPGEVCTASDPTEARALAARGLPYLEADPQAGHFLRDRWGLLSAAQHVSVEVKALPSGPETPLLDQFPGLQTLLPDAAENIRIVPCSSLRREVRTADGRTGVDHELIGEGDRLLFSDQLSSEELLQRLATHFSVSLDEAATRQILDFRKLVESRARTAEIRANKTLAGKLLAAVGAEALLRRLPRGLLEAVEESGGAASPKRAAELALAVYGVDTLHVFRQDLEANGLPPPAGWAGSHHARVFVKSLGFPPEFAGFGQRRRDPVLEVLGPPLLLPLHPFQEKIVLAIEKMAGDRERRRAIVSLPTGAGKTRVAVEGLIRFLKAQKRTGPILWVAQSDELCEQAVQTWSYVWRSVGPAEPLMINRLWATNEADAETEIAQVVVATIQKLQGCFDDPSYDWLAQASWVIIDEAHGAIEKTYTALLNWQGFGRKADRCPLLGLTATPFRGGEEETERLVRRFGGTRLDREALSENPYAELQEMGVLARVDHRILKGSTLELSDQELENLHKLRMLPPSAGDRLGADVSRNEMLLQCIRALDPEWPVLLFAVSVDHAQTMAALLSMEGITAAAISAQTEVGARRHYIEEFRKGRLRVLTNFAVLTAGFDAPSVAAIIVARPTYSPVLYQQMIGRGLRGPLNGGKERCLIVNVEDNISRFGDELAFRQFEHLWKPVEPQDEA